MSFFDLLILQVIAHVLADFVFQTDVWVRHRQIFGLKSKILYWHILLVFLLSYGLSFQWNFVFYSLAITITHFILDSLKKIFSNLSVRKRNLFRKKIFFIDQAMHLIIIVITVYVFSVIIGINPYLNWEIQTRHLLMALGYITCNKPANIIIREIFSYNKIKAISNVGDELMNAGKLIGNIERFLTLTLILFNQFSAVGFILAAKSIIRYKESETHKMEYYLIGSLLSFGLAITIGIGIRLLF